MRVSIISCVYPPEPVVSSQTSAQLSQALIEQGHEVHVIVPFPNRPAGKLYPGYSRRLLRRDVAQRDFAVTRCFSVLSGESSAINRFLENISFGLTSGLAALLARRPNVIYSNTWPIFATGILWFVSRIRSVPMVISVQDVYPESLIAQGRIRADSWLAQLLMKIDRYVAQRCHSIIVISESFASIYRDRRGILSERLHVVPNWIDEQSIIVDDARAVDLRAVLNIPPESVLMVYGGNIGTAAGVETVIESFQYLDDEDNVYLLIAGEGARLTECQRLAKAMGSQRIQFYSPWPQTDTSMILSAADVLLLPTRGTQSLASVPSKLIAYMMTARPVVALAVPRSDLADLVTKAECGWLVEPDQPDLLANVLKEVATYDKSVLQRRGQAGREFALTHLSRNACLPQIVEILEKAAK